MTHRNPGTVIQAVPFIDAADESGINQQTARFCSVPRVADCWVLQVVERRWEAAKVVNGRGCCRGNDARVTGLPVR